MNKLKRRELRVLEAFCLAGVSCSSTEILRIIEGHGKKMLLRTFYAAVNGLMKKGMLVYADEKYRRVSYMVTKKGITALKLLAIERCLHMVV